MKFAPFLLAVSTLVSTVSFSQRTPLSSMYWNSYQQFNPAVTSLNYAHEGNVTWKNTNSPSMAASYSQNNLLANYGMRLAKLKSGIGVNYSSEYSKASETHFTSLSYAYHLPLKNATFSIGTALGLKTNKTHVDLSGAVFFTTHNGPLIYDIEETNFQADLGFNYKLKKWNLGASANQLNFLFMDSKNGERTDFWAFIEYNTALGNNWSIHPRIRLYADSYNFYSSYINVSACYKNKLNFGVGYANVFSNYSTPSVHGSYDFKEKWRVGYAFGQQLSFSKLNNDHFSSISHEITLGFLLR